MGTSQPELNEWQRLHEAAIRVKEIAPWEFMEETDVFGVQNPETRELGFVSVMGLLGEYLGLSVYLGAKGLYEFWEIEHADPSTPPERLLEIPQLQVSFENRNDLKAKDREIIKELGLKFRGRKAWPMFRSIRPGFIPWFLEAGEVRFLAHVLEQSSDVVLRFKEDPSLLEPLDEDSYLVRVPRHNEDRLEWEDEIMRIQPPAPTLIPLVMEDELLEELQSLPQSDYTLEIDFFMLPAAIGEKGTRLRHAYSLLSVEGKSGFILGTDVLSLESSLEEMWGEIPLSLVEQLVHVGVLPREVRVRSGLLLRVLAPLAEEVPFSLKHSLRLPSLDLAKESLIQFFRRAR
jgi:hypothetical protein